jgi:alpha-tubulin suppressor-like RCC1 family protein
MKQLVKATVLGLGPALVLLGTPLAASAATPAAPAATPAIISFKVSPSPVPAAGAKVTMAVRVRAARTCMFSITPKVAGFPVTRSCSSGHVTVTIRFPANDSISTKHFTVKLSAKASRTVSATRKLAQPPVTLTGVRAVTGEDDSYCAVLTSGRVDCWGAGTLGQLGYGKGKNSTRPEPVTGVGGKGLLTGVTSVVAGAFGYGDSYCAVLHSGGVDCWGLDQDGQLGGGSTVNSDKPVAVKGVGGTGLLTGVTELQAEVYGFCADLSDGGAACWGLNSSGELGNGSLSGPDTCGADSFSCSTTPVDVVGTSGTGTLGQIARLVGEGSSMCAVLTSGRLDCWGDGSNGQLGNGSESGSAVPVQVQGIDGSGSLAGVTSLTGINDNGSSLCARLTSGKADCWGDDTWAELGNGSSPTVLNDSDTPVAVEGVGGKGTLSGVASVLGVPGLTNCAILTSGGVDCWGYNGDSVTGDPSVGLTSNVPVKVAGPSGKGSLAGVASLVSGNNPETGGNLCALLTSGGVDCWGQASAGASTTPVAVPGFGPKKPLVRVRSLVSDQDGSNCAVLVTGGVDCWGADASGQLGNGTHASGVGPEAVLGPA